MLRSDSTILENLTCIAPISPRVRPLRPHAITNILAILQRVRDADTGRMAAPRVSRPYVAKFTTRLFLELSQAAKHLRRLATERAKRSPESEDQRHDQCDERRAERRTRQPHERQRHQLGDNAPARERADGHSKRRRRQP